MAKPTPSTEALTRAEIRRRWNEYRAIDLQLTELLAEAFATKNLYANPTLGEAELNKLALERARQILNGGVVDSSPPAPETFADQLLPAPLRLPDANTPWIERLAVRLIMGALQTKEIEGEAAESAQWALDHNAEWAKLISRWLAAAKAFAAAEAAAEAFLEPAGEAKYSLQDPPGIARISIVGDRIEAVATVTSNGGRESGTEFGRASRVNY